MTNTDTFGNAGKGGTGKYIALKDDGDSATFYVPLGNEVTQSCKVWEGGKSRNASPGEEGATTKFAVQVRGLVDGKFVTQQLEQTNNFWKRFRGCAEKVGGSLYSHLFEVERIGEKGSMSTTYRFKAIAPAPVEKPAAETAPMSDGEVKRIFS